MGIDSILAEIDAEIARLTQARALLATMGSATPAATKVKAATKTAKKVGKKRVLSPEARKRIADAQRKRWAAQRAKGKAK
jgi:sugar/nucleoside kinase (ribokinase family)